METFREVIDKMVEIEEQLKNPSKGDSNYTLAALLNMRRELGNTTMGVRIGDLKTMVARLVDVPKEDINVVLSCEQRVPSRGDLDCRPFDLMLSFKGGKGYGIDSNRGTMSVMLLDNVSVYLDQVMPDGNLLKDYTHTLRQSSKDYSPLMIDGDIADHVIASIPASEFVTPYNNGGEIYKLKVDAIKQLDDFYNGIDRGM